MTIPNVSGPAPSVCLESTGRSTFTLNANDMTTTAISVSTSTGRVFQTYESPSRAPANMVGRPRPVSG